MIASETIPEPLSLEPTSVATPEQMIRERAYEIYEQRGRGQGKDVDDCLTAETELLKRSLPA